jgi:hypothetical protein
VASQATGPKGGTRPRRDALLDRPRRRAPPWNRKQNGPLAGDRLQAVNKRTTSRDQGCFGKPVENRLCDVSRLSFRG